MIFIPIHRLRKSRPSVNTVILPSPLALETNTSGFLPILWTDSFDFVSTLKNFPANLIFSRVVSSLDSDFLSR